MLGEVNSRKRLSSSTDFDDSKKQKARVSKEIGFVVNPIIVGPRKSQLSNYVDYSDSSDESDDGTFSSGQFEEAISGEVFPFRSYKEKVITKKKSKGKPFKVPTKGFLYPKVKSPGDVYEIEFGDHSTKSLVIGRFLDKLEREGFEIEDRDLTRDTLKASICLNKMLSVSTRENLVLYYELSSNIETDIRFEKFGVFWKCQWLDAKGRAVEYEKVKKFYKQLKRKDKESAEKFLKFNEYEAGIKVPYQELREFTKNHDKTKKLAREFRAEKPDADLFLSVVDGDTVDFNGIYSGYKRILQDQTPTVMSTGYEFPMDPEYGDVFKLASMIDRSIRVITNSIIPGGTYFPEPNMCILIPPNQDTVPESFIDKKGSGDGNSESVAMMRNIVGEREGASFVYSDDNPLITSIMKRAKLTKVHKTPITISFNGKNGFALSEKDLQTLEQVSQSHFNRKVWYDNLLINDAIKIHGYSKTEVKHLISRIRNKKSKEDFEDAVRALKTFIEPKIVDAMIEASTAIAQYLDKFKIKYVNNENEKRLLEVLDKIEGVDLNKLPIEFRRDIILMLSQIEVIEMIEDGSVDFIRITESVKNGNITLQELEEIFYNEKILELIREEITFQTLIEFCEVVKKSGKKFLDEIDKILDGADNNNALESYGVENLLKFYILIAGSTEDSYDSVMGKVEYLCEIVGADFSSNLRDFEMFAELYETCRKRYKSFEEIAGHIEQVCLISGDPEVLEDALEGYAQHPVHLQCVYARNTTEVMDGNKDISFVIANHYNDKEALLEIISCEDYKEEYDLTSVLKLVEGSQRLALVNNLKEIALERIYGDLGKEDTSYARIRLREDFIHEVFELEDDEISKISSISLQKMIELYRAIGDYEKEQSPLEVISSIQYCGYNASNSIDLNDVPTRVICKLYKLLYSKQDPNPTETLRDICLEAGEYLTEERFVEFYASIPNPRDELADLIGKMDMVPDTLFGELVDAYNNGNLDQVLDAPTLGHNVVDSSE